MITIDWLRNYITTTFLLLAAQSNTIIATAQTKIYPNNNDSNTQIIGFATTLLTNNKPEGLLGNFIVDAVKNEAEIYLRKRINLVFINSSAVRGAIPKGNITMQTIEEILPFDDSLAYLQVQGDTLKKILDMIAQNGGMPVAGVRMKIKNMRATNIILDGDSIFPEKKYLLVLIERNAQGWQKFSFLKNIPYKNLPNTLTSTVIRYIKKLTSEGKPVNAFFGHRISYD
ncbi:MULTISPECIES: 5'-nucleotidase C-terminal domain-containing protein [Chitinophagaceae]